MSFATPICMFPSTNQVFVDRGRAHGGRGQAIEAAKQR